MSYLLDTNVISGLRIRADRADARVVQWAASRHNVELFISVVNPWEPPG